MVRFGSRQARFALSLLLFFGTTAGICLVVAGSWGVESLAQGVQEHGPVAASPFVAAVSDRSPTPPTAAAPEPLPAKDAVATGPAAPEAVADDNAADASDASQSVADQDAAAATAVPESVPDAVPTVETVDETQEMPAPVAKRKTARFAKRNGHRKGSLDQAGLNAIRMKRQLSEADVVRLLRHSGFPEGHIPALVCTVKNESSFLPRAHNINESDGSHDTGLFQINDLWLPECKMTRSDLFDPLKNAKCAHIVYRQQGMSAWLGFTRKHECRTYQLAETD